MVSNSFSLENALMHSGVQWKTTFLLVVKQYVPKKPVKRGFKVWVRADAVSGYVSELNFYTKKGPGSIG